MTLLARGRANDREIFEDHHDGGVSPRGQHLVQHTGDNRAAESEPGGEEAADRSDEAGRRPVQELSGGAARGEDQHRRVRVQGEGRVRDTGADQARVQARGSTEAETGNHWPAKDHRLGQERGCRARGRRAGKPI